MDYRGVGLGRGRVTSFGLTTGRRRRDHRDRSAKNAPAEAWIADWSRIPGQTGKGVSGR